LTEARLAEQRLRLELEKVRDYRHVEQEWQRAFADWQMLHEQLDQVAKYEAAYRARLLAPYAESLARAKQSKAKLAHEMGDVQQQLNELGQVHDPSSLIVDLQRFEQELVKELFW